MTNPRCDNCKWGLSYPKAGPEPKRPSKHWPLSLMSGMETVATYDWWKFHEVQHEQFIRCIRYPEVVRKTKEGLCGEHTPTKAKSPATIK